MCEAHQHGSTPESSEGAHSEHEHASHDHGSHDHAAHEHGHQHVAATTGAETAECPVMKGSYVSKADASAPGDAPERPLGTTKYTKYTRGPARLPARAAGARSAAMGEPRKHAERRGRARFARNHGLHGLHGSAPGKRRRSGGLSV